MDQTASVLLDLIKSSLWGTPLPDYDSPYDEPVDWDAVFEEAKIQTVAGIAAPAVPNSAPTELRSKWKTYSYQILAAIYYPNPSQRNMGMWTSLVRKDCETKCKYY